MIRPPRTRGGRNYPMLLLVALWAVVVTVLIFREPAAAAVLMAIVPIAARNA